MKTTIDCLQPAHVAAGIGGAGREFLAVCLGVLDDATLAAHLKQFLDKRLATWRRAADRGISTSVERSVERWLGNGDLSDDHLRAMLWIRLQQALRVNPSVSRSVRGCGHLADDLVVAGLKWRDDRASKGPVGRALERARRVVSNLRNARENAAVSDDEQADLVPNTLASLVEPLLLEMVRHALDEDANAMPEKDRKRLTAGIVAELEEDERQALLREAGERDINGALAKLATVGGAHGSFALAVGATGFAPYILAAQASAFVPMVSGPALVSLVSVLANPVVVVGAAVGLGVYLTRKANERAAAQVALHVIGLLACDGLGRGRDSLENLVASFQTIPDLTKDAFRDRREESNYKALWDDLGRSSWLAPPGPRPPLADDWERTDMRRDTVAIGGASIGDLMYSLAAIDPQVVAAADFSRSDQIGDPLDFAAHLLGKVQERWYERAGVDPATREGEIAQMKGFTMEQLAATKLTDDGYAVELPDVPNRPGWDLIVDGERFQVKCVADSSLLADHFEKYPDIPVLANSDLMADREQWPEAWQEKMFFLEGHTNELVEGIVRRSFAEGKDLADNDVPEIALAYVAGR